MFLTHRFSFLGCFIVVATRCCAIVDAAAEDHTHFSHLPRNGTVEATVAAGVATILDMDDDGSSVGGFGAESSFSNISSPAPEERSLRLGADMGEPQLIGQSNAQETLDKIQADRVYLQEEVMVEEKYTKVRDICLNQHQSCVFWSLIGECEKNPSYMKINCAPACRSCDYLDVDQRCPKDPNAVDALQPGDVDKLFERIVNNEEYKQYEPVVLSRPPEGPWLIMFENAFSDEEAERLIELGGTLGYERSTNVGNVKLDGTFDKRVSSTRTSMNTWCFKECDQDPLANGLVQRIEDITGVPSVNSENLQLLRYESGQFYQTHSDYIPGQRDRPTGVRILTFYCYLNDVEHGGGTRFPALNMTVTPKRGRAVLWPSVLNDDPNNKDGRTVHEAMPVGEGSVKFGANAWIHMRDYKVRIHYLECRMFVCGIWNDGCSMSVLSGFSTSPPSSERFYFCPTRPTTPRDVELTSSYICKI